MLLPAKVLLVELVSVIAIVEVPASTVAVPQFQTVPVLVSVRVPEPIVSVLPVAG